MNELPPANARALRSRTPIRILLPRAPALRQPIQPSQYAKTFAVALGLIILVGTLLLATPWTTESGQRSPFSDALFTSVSASTVTGLVTVDTATHWNLLGEVVILLLIQSGGLGFMVGASLLLQFLRRGTRRLRDELLVKEGAPVLSLQEAVSLSRRIVIFTFTVEGMGALCLTISYWGEMSFLNALWHGVFHAISAFCSAGFDLNGNFASFAAEQTSPLVNFTLIAMIQFGGLSYIVFEDLVRCRRWNRLELDTKLVLSGNAFFVLWGTLAFLAFEWTNALVNTPVIDRPMVALFHSVSARSGGIVTVNWAGVQTVTLFLWTGLMLVGGAAGSTAGGVKLTTIGVVAASVVSTLRGLEEPQIFRRRISSQLVFRAMAVIVLMMTMHFVATTALAITEDLWANAEFGFLKLMFETMSALTTCGMSTGITPSLTTAGKLVLCATMFVGRLGPLTAAYALQRRQRPTRYRYPAAAVRIG
jgi:trk system potassium uptake protein